MRILRLPSYCFPEQVSSSHLDEDLFLACQHAGIESEIYVPTPTRGISEEVREQYKKIKKEERYDGTVKIKRFCMFQERKNTIYRAVRYVLINLVQFVKGINAKNIDLVYGTSTPPTQGVVCALVKSILKVPFVYNLQDIFPDSMVNAGMTKEGSIIWKIGRVVENYIYKHADKIIVIGEDFKQNIVKKGVCADKIEVIYNWVDENKVYPIERTENVLFERYNLEPNKFYITYCGNIGHSQNFEMLIEVAKRLKLNKDIEFVLIGEGAFKMQLEKIIQDEQIDNITLLPFQPYEDIAYVFSLGDVGLIISKPNIGTSSVPSKTWSIMSAARPVLASFDLNSELCDIISKNECGLCVDPGDVDAFVEGVLYLKQDKNRLQIMGRNSRNFILNNLTKDICTKKYIGVFEEVFQKRQKNRTCER